MECQSSFSTGKEIYTLAEMGRELGIEKHIEVRDVSLIFLLPVSKDCLFLAILLFSKTSVALATLVVSVLRRFLMGFSVAWKLHLVEILPVLSQELAIFVEKVQVLSS
jgi:hypothetical protein